MKSLTNQPLTAGESEYFYPLMALQKNGAAQGWAAKAESVPVIQWLGAPQSWAGKLVHASLWTRRATKVAVTEPAIIRIIGQDYYWQIDAFADLGKVNIQFEKSGPGTDPVDFGSRYPVNVVALELPAGMQQGILEDAGEHAVVSKVNVPIEVDAVFYRMWGYDSDWMRENVGQRQIAPLLVSLRLLDGAPGGLDATALRRISWIWVSLILATLVVGASLVWRSYVSDQRAASKGPPSLSAEETIFLQTLGEPKNQETTSSSDAS